MSISWDPKPFPQHLDISERHTFYGVGLVMSCWESVEFELARLYSLFASEPDGPILQTGYGSERIFAERLAALSRRAHKFFIQWPHQDIEGLLDRLLGRAEDLSVERNNVAHGIVFDVSNITIFRDRFPQTYGRKPQYALIPPLYTMRRHANGVPTYAYSFPEMRALANDLLALTDDVSEFRKALSDSLREWQAALP